MDNEGIMDREPRRDITPWCRISIDKEGRWFYEGQEIINPGVLQTFYEALEFCDDSRYRIVLGHEVCYVEVEDTPFVVMTLRGDNSQGFTLVLNTGQNYTLDPSTLMIGRNNILYARLPDGMPVRLSRPAYYLLAMSMEESPDGVIFLRVGQRMYPLHTRTQS